MPKLPDWMGERPTDSEPAAPLQPLRGSRRVRRALAGFVGLIAAPLFRPVGGERAGWIQRLDPRAKLLGILGLVVLTSLLTSWRAFALDALVCLLLAVVSRAPVKPLLGAWMAIPLFSALIVWPTALNVVSPGETLVPLGPSVGLTAAGLEMAARFVVRSLLCVTLVAFLPVTTRADELVGGLRALGLPKTFVMLLTMMERYIGVLARTAQEIHLAKLSRTIQPGSLRQERAWAAAGAGTLFRRSRALGDAVYLAMLSRGYRGEARLLDESQWQTADSLFLAAACVACALLLGMEVGT